MKILYRLLTALLFMVGTLHAAQNTLALKTIQGKTLHVIGNQKGFTIPEYQGKIMFVEFWGTHCPPCLMSIPHYIELQEKYKDDLAMLAVEVQATPLESLKAFVKAKGINYDIVSHREGYRFIDYITRSAGWQGRIPLLLILDQEGVVQIVQPGFIRQKDLELVIQDLIRKRQQQPHSKTENNQSKPRTESPAASQPHTENNSSK